MTRVTTESMAGAVSQDAAEASIGEAVRLRDCAAIGLMVDELPTGGEGLAVDFKQGAVFYLDFENFQR